MTVFKRCRYCASDVLTMTEGLVPKKEVLVYLVIMYLLIMCVPPHHPFLLQNTPLPKPKQTNKQNTACLIPAFWSSRNNQRWATVTKAARAVALLAAGRWRGADCCVLSYLWSLVALTAFYLWVRSSGRGLFVVGPWLVWWQRGCLRLGDPPPTWLPRLHPSCPGLPWPPFPRGFCRCPVPDRVTTQSHFFRGTSFRSHGWQR